MSRSTMFRWLKKCTFRGNSSTELVSHMSECHQKVCSASCPICKKDCIEEVRQLAGLGMKIPSCFGVVGMAKKVVWHSGNCKSVLALHRWREKCFGVPGMSRKVFWHLGNGKKSVLVLWEWDCGDGKNKFYGVAGVTIWPPLAAIKSELRFWT